MRAPRPLWAVFRLGVLLAFAWSCHDSGTPTDATPPEVSGPDADRPEAEGPEAEGPEAEEPEAEGPEAEGPDPKEPEAEEPEAEEPEAEKPHPEEPEPEEPEPAQPDPEEPDAEEPAPEPDPETEPEAEGPDTEPDPVVVAVGDIVCGTRTSASAACEHAATASLVGTIDPTAVLLLGDNQYEDGSLADFNAYYDPTWGAHKSITWPSAGNHEYQTAGAKGYYDYFNGPGARNGRAGHRNRGYYSFDLGAWHLIALNSNCAAVGGCDEGSPQEKWLRADLAANPSTCTLAYWHHPRFSSGKHGDASSMEAIWRALHDHRADLVLAGHDHHYERFAPQTATGEARETGIRSFVVGTGGKDLRSFGPIAANSERRGNKAFGVLKLTLRSADYDWEFVPIPGDAFNDVGTAACVPPRATTLTVAAGADA